MIKQYKNKQQYFNKVKSSKKHKLNNIIVNEFNKTIRVYQ